jgi:hypothetical protein
VGVKHGRRLWLTTSTPRVSRMSGKCEVLDDSQPYKLPYPVTGIALLTVCLETWSFDDRCQNIRARHFAGKY